MRSSSENTRVNHGGSEQVYSPAVERLITELAKLPGIGPRSAQRLAYHILKTRPEEILPLAASIVEVKEKIGFCVRCFNLAEGELCTICSDARRDAAVICVVEQPADIIPVERTREFRGLYHVLGGALSPLDGVEPSDLRIAELVARAEDGVEEVILATNPTMTGEATALYIADQLPERVRVSRLASGLPVGSDLEYADELTLGRALVGRRDVRLGQH
jgi:recombination protein RecR